MNGRKNGNLQGAESQAIDAGSKAAIALGTKAISEEGLSKEEAITGTLGVVAAAAAPFVPWGTVASVVIMAGVTIFKGMSAAEKAEIEFNKKLNELESKLDYLKVISSTIAKASKRPKMPLDLYSGPPMYWIVPSPEIEPPTNKKYYTLPNGSVEWPCADQGGFTPMKNTNKQNINVDDVYAPFKPNVNNNPSICIFFWAVPIFFARFQQLIGEKIYGEEYDPKAIDQSTGKPIEVGLAEVVKALMSEGRLDAAGNWYAKIGTVIPALAADDDDYAPRYYGRNAWVHNLALQNVKFADGTRIASSGIKFNNSTEFFNSPTAKKAIEVSNEYAAAKPRFVAVVGKPYYLANSLLDAPTPVMNSGQVLDLKDLVSHYDRGDGAFNIPRQAIINSPNSSNESLYYVVSIPVKTSQKISHNLYWRNSSTAKGEAALTIAATAAGAVLYTAPLVLTGAGAFKDREITRVVGNALIFTGDWGRMKFEDGVAARATFSAIAETTITTEDFYRTIIRGAGGFNQWGLTEMLKTGDGIRPNFPSLDYVKAGLVWNYDFLASRVHGKFALAPFQLYIASKCEQIGENNVPRPYIYGNDETHSTYGFFDFDPEPFTYEEVAGLWNGELKIGKFDWLRNLALMPAYKADINAKSDEYVFSKAIEQTGLVNYYDSAADLLLVKKDYNLDDVSSAARNESFAYRTFNVVNTFSNINEIVKLRPPRAGEPTIKLRREFWGEGEPWAKLQEKDEVNFAIVKSSTLTVFEFRRDQLKYLKNTIKAPPLTRAYFRTNLEENKPIVELNDPNNPDPSPFYCGRRADPRTKWAWRKIRLTTTGQGEESKDTGWEDCHEWSWPYQTPVLAEIGRISGNIYKDFGEGIGRSGLSISSIATGPTIWGDAALYISRYSSIKGGSTKFGTKTFDKTKAQAMWQAMLEMQTGAYSRYAYLPNNLNSTFAEDLQKQFSMFTNNSTARAKFLQDAQASTDKGNKPRRYNPKTGAPIYMTPQEAADYCMSIVDAWFNGTFPRPTAQYQQYFKKKEWDSDVLDKVARAHIRLKNWAIDIGKPEKERKNHKFPDDAFSINYFGLNKANRIAIESYNSIVDEKAKVTNPIQIGINQTKHYDKKEKVLLSENRERPTPILLKPTVMVTAAATLATIAIISRLTGKK